MSPIGPAAAVYILCLLTSATCAFLLVRSYNRTKAGLLLWTAVCFVLLALNNLFVVADMILFPDINFWALRQIAAFAAVGVLLYGFIWESE
ncbi:MAG TPA: DUF5985 family protein [Caulobacteraceae bacterium]|nr:DUF5985 family protein [Caulobacteraceae bacterium]